MQGCSNPRPTTLAMLPQPPALHLLSKTNQSRKPQHPPTRRRRSRRCWAQSNLYCSLLSPNPPGYSESNRPLCPSSPAAPATFCLRHPTLTCWPFDFEQPNQGPGPSSRRRLLRLEGQLPPTTLSPRPISPPARPLCPPSEPRSPFPFARPTPLAALQPGCFACLAAPRPCHRGGRSSALHPRTNGVIEAIPTLAAINTPVRLGNPLPLAKHVSCLQGLPRWGGECHPLASPDRLPIHEMTLSTRTHDASFGPVYHQRRPTSARNCFRGCARGLTANKLHCLPHCGTRSVVAWPRNVLPPPPPPPPHHQSSSAPSLVHPPPPRGAGYYAGPQPCAPPERWFGSRTCPSIGRNQPS